MEPASTSTIQGGRQEANRGEVRTVERQRRKEKKRWVSPPFRCPLRGLEAVCAVLPGRLLLVGAELEVLGGQFEAQGVGSQRVDHVLVAFSTVLHQERTPVGLRGADQLQTLQEERQHKLGACRRRRHIRSYQ